MRGIPQPPGPAAAAGGGGDGGAAGRAAEKTAESSLLKAKHRLEQESEEDVEEFPRKKRKRIPGKQQQAGRHPCLQPQSRRIQRDPPAYTAGSLEEKWHLEILEKGRITCPTCRAVVRKTVAGLKKHMAGCQQMLTCPHCGKRLRSLAGMKYHVMAEHNSLPVVTEGGQLDEPSERDRLRRVLKRVGKLRCPREGCTGNFTSIVGYLYHAQKCGKAAAELEKMALKCPHCSKTYRSKAGLAYHLKSEHGPVPLLQEDSRHGPLREVSAEPSGGGGKVQRESAKVATFYLHELAHEELAREWPKRKVLQDLVPDDRKLKYTRPGLPTVSQEVLCKWRSEIKTHQRVHCPNQGCGCAYSSISGLKSHLGNCTLGEFVAGKYKCLLCEKEFVSESGVKYHINTVHAEDWFDVSVNTAKSFGKLRKPQQKGAEQKRHRKKPLCGRSKRQPRTRVAPRPGPARPSPRRAKVGRLPPPAADSESRSSEEQDPQPQAEKLSHRRRKK
ncbi:zinc finger protein 512 isoform X2 [Hemicordylus capensis]|uniref:zinc finger protein 512 isoform X2 n=1 Tax=Hemicordylus capensis TaxID=884348 RepID=UPI002303C43C|nr:zinc finger protein 512 isoform X2 [Hemicordylus capensis]